ncbi:hypothetical protein SAMN05216174_101551 [Actinokineospora iranica]|uniref:Uncharacterized protein n=2 Tax=Actinokineospora iranica TaxID=1271860 RepID=A0A1G6JTT0_9PSEU|nr:hypothetical protein SAMN05216174_101551 [Actinokineospora iranica]
MADDCFVDVARANFRRTPGGVILGTVGRGQGFHTYDQLDDWYRGDLWGGERGVWMHWSVLGPPCGD